MLRACPASSSPALAARLPFRPASSFSSARCTSSSAAILPPSSAGDDFSMPAAAPSRACKSLTQVSAFSPVIASTRRTPAATPPSATILNRPMSPVRATCVPPQSSRDDPMSSTRTSSPYFSPNNIIAPVFLASSIGSTRARVAAFASTSRLTSRSTSAISAAVIGWPCAKSKRVLSTSTSEPFCCTCGPRTSRSALCSRCVAEWLRMIARRWLVATAAVTASPIFSVPDSSRPACAKAPPLIFCVSVTLKPFSAREKGWDEGLSD